ncbi:MAG TPA: hypothetical protein DDW50_01445 [Firmicutes bacterium]|nr:hypothetical protein [Bacillota bacterium]
MKLLKMSLWGFILVIGVISFFNGNFIWAAGSNVVAPLRIHFIGGSGIDSAFIRTPNHHTLLINSGDCDTGKIDSYLKLKKVKQIDVLVITHPGQAYFENISRIIRKYKVGEIYAANAVMDTETAIAMQKLGKGGNVIIQNIQGGHFINIDPALIIEILAPNKLKYDSLGDGEPILKIMYNKISFLFCGTISHISKREILKLNYDLKADVLKLGSIGNNDGLNQRFLRAVSPRYAVITDENVYSDANDPGLLMEQLLGAGLNLYRTNSESTIVFSTDGQKIKIKQEFQ